MNGIISTLEKSNQAIEQQLRTSQSQLDQHRAQLQLRDQQLRSLEADAKTSELERTQLAREIDQLRDDVACAAAAHDEDVAQIARLAKDRRRWEVAKRESDKRAAALDEERRALAERVAALEADRPQGTQKASVFPDYIRTVLLQFFIQDGATRDALIPVILNLVQCEQRQVAQAMRCWADSNQIISHAFALFKK
jgi:chromosome segregation ATPase